MTLLCLDTSTRRITAAIADPHTGAVLAQATSEERAQSLLVLVDALLAQADMRAEDLTAISVGVGPGGFTGLRVGIATARGLAETLGIPLHAVGSLSALGAETAHAHPGSVVWAVQAPQRGECFVQPLQLDPATGRVAERAPTRAVAVDAIDDVVGTDLRVQETSPTPGSLVRAALDSLASDPAAGDPLRVIPIYGREPDAQPRRIDARLEAARPSDIDELLQLEARCFATPWSRAMYEEELRRLDTDAVRLVVRDRDRGGRIVGAALAARIGDCWHILNVLVDPIARRQGIAARLVAQLLERTGARGAGEGWLLEVRDGNDAAVALYERAGFTHAGRRRGYYAETGEDALVMWRDAEQAEVPA